MTFILFSWNLPQLRLEVFVWGVLMLLMILRCLIGSFLEDLTVWLRIIPSAKFGMRKFASRSDLQGLQEVCLSLWHVS